MADKYTTLQDQIRAANTTLNETQTDLETTKLDLESTQIQYKERVTQYEADTTLYNTQSEQQLAHYNEMQANVDEMQANVNSMLENKHNIVQSIELLSLSYGEYTQKLDKIQRYSSGLNMAMNQLRGSIDLRKNSAEYHASMEEMLDLFSNFLDWFECTFTTKLYDFSCLLLNSQIE